MAELCTLHNNVCCELVYFWSASVGPIHCCGDTKEYVPDRKQA